MQDGLPERVRAEGLGIVLPSECQQQQPCYCDRALPHAKFGVATRGTRHVCGTRTRSTMNCSYVLRTLLGVTGPLSFSCCCVSGCGCSRCYIVYVPPVQFRHALLVSTDIESCKKPVSPGRRTGLCRIVCCDTLAFRVFDSWARTTQRDGRSRESVARVCHTFWRQCSIRGLQPRRIVDTIMSFLMMFPSRSKSHMLVHLVDEYSRMRSISPV